MDFKLMSTLFLKLNICVRAPQIDLVMVRVPTTSTRYYLVALTRRLFYLGTYLCTYPTGKVCGVIRIGGLYLALCTNVLLH